MALELPRRGFLLGALAAIAAPVVVRAQSIMPVRALPPELLRSAPLLVERLMVQSVSRNIRAHELASLRLHLAGGLLFDEPRGIRIPIKGVRSVEINHHVDVRPIYSVFHRDPILHVQGYKHTDGLIECDLSSLAARVEHGDLVEVSYPTDGGPATVDVIKTGAPQHDMGRPARHRDS
jgi:hypothetical protein